MACQIPLAAQVSMNQGQKIMRTLVSLALVLAFAGVCCAQVGSLSIGPSCDAVQPAPGAPCANSGCGNPRCTRCRPKICVNVPETICIKRPCGQEKPRELTPPS